MRAKAGGCEVCEGVGVELKEGGRWEAGVEGWGCLGLKVGSWEQMFRLASFSDLLHDLS